jgi:hypothetical protein
MTWRKHTTSIVLAASAVALAVWIWIDRASVTDTERAMRPKNVLSAFRREELSRIEIDQGPGHDKLVLVRDVDRDADASWRLELPRPDLADPNAVEQLTSALEFATFVRKLDPKTTTTFDLPRATGTITMGKLVYRFVLGGMAPTPEGASYLKVDGEGVFVVSKELTDRLLTPATAYRTRTIVPYLSLDLASLEVHGNGINLRLDRLNELSFKLGGSGLRASRAELDKLWSAFAEMRAESFTDADVKEPVITIVMTPKDGRPRGEIFVGAACPDHPDDVVVVRTAPTRMSACAPRGIVEGLSQSSETLVDTRMFFAHEDELEELTLTNEGGMKIDLARKGSGWHARAPFDRDLGGDEVDAANTLASGVIRAKGTNVVTFRPDEPFTLRSRVRVHGGEMPGDELIELGEGAQHAWVVHRLADNAYLDVTVDVARRLQASTSALKGRDVIVPALDPKDVDSVSLRCGTAQDLRRDGSTWKLGVPSGYGADQAGTLDLIDQIAHLRVESWVADRDDGSFGFGSACAVTLGAKHDGGARTVKLELGREVDLGVYAIIDDGGTKSPVFLEPRIFRDALARILVDKSALTIDSANASSIVLSRAGAHIELRRVADRLVGPDAGMATSTASIASALDTLRADDVVRLGPPQADEGFSAPSLEVQVELEGDGGKRSVHLRFGRDVLRRNQTMVLTRVSGVDATFAVARERVDPIRNAL